MTEADALKVVEAVIERFKARGFDCKNVADDLSNLLDTMITKTDEKPAVVSKSPTPYEIIVVCLSAYLIRMESNSNLTMGDMARHLLSELDRAGYLIVPKEH
jgi:hypothetical protein